MSLHFNPEPVLDEVKPWRLNHQPPLLPLTNYAPQYAIILIMAGDDLKLGSRVEKDLNEISLGVHGGQEISVLVLADMCKPKRQSVYYEITNSGSNILKQDLSIDTGDPRPIAAFISAALHSLHPDTKIAIGLWGHGEGAIGDLDPNENLVPEELRELPIGTPISESDFLRYDLITHDPIKSFVYKSMLPDMETGNVLTNRELSSALTVAFSRAKRTEPVDMVFFDTCFNGAAEVYAEVRRYARTFVASSLRLPGKGWSYTDFLQRTRKTQPSTPQDWARLAVSSCEDAYRHYPVPVHIAALHCHTDALQHLKNVVERIQSFPKEQAVSLVKQASRDLKDVGRNESLDLFHVVNSIRKVTEDQALIETCADFLASYQATVIATTVTSENRFYSGLSVWFPRLQDTHKVHSYYHHLQFNKETGWLNLVHHLIYHQQRASSVFLVCRFQGVKLLEAHPVGQLTIDTNSLRETSLLLKVSEISAPWTTQFQEGRYSFQKTESIAFPSHSDFRKFVDVLLNVRRHDTEFEALKQARYSAVTMDVLQAKQLSRALWKYKNIVSDEFPDQVGSYTALQDLLEHADGSTLIVIGQGSRAHRPEPEVSTMLRASDLLTRLTFGLLTESPKEFHLNINSIQYYKGPLDVHELPEHKSLDISDMLDVFSGLRLEELNGIHIHVAKITDAQGHDNYSAILSVGDIVPKEKAAFNYQWSQWEICQKCGELHSTFEACPVCHPPAISSGIEWVFSKRAQGLEA